MILESINEIIETIQQDENLTEEKKENLLNKCHKLHQSIQTIENFNSSETKQKLQKLNNLEQFETNNPKLTACIDMLARTLSRLGV